MKHAEINWWASEKPSSLDKILASEIREEHGLGEKVLQGWLLSDLSTCKANFSTAIAFGSCSPVQKVENVAY